MKINAREGELEITQPQWELLGKKATISGDNATALAALVYPVIGTMEREGEYAGFPAITLPWCGMWLCVEPDGYCHT